MALSKNYVKNLCGKEITFENAYIQIIYDNGDKHNRNIQIIIYDNAQKQNVIEQKNYSFIPNVEDNAPNFIKQGYEYLKTLDEYKGTVDLLDEGQTA